MIGRRSTLKLSKHDEVGSTQVHQCYHKRRGSSILLRANSAKTNGLMALIVRQFSGVPRCYMTLCMISSAVLIVLTAAAFTAFGAWSFS